VESGDDARMLRAARRDVGGFRIKIDDYRDLGERVVALGVARGAGSSSHIEVASHFAAVFVVRNSRFVLVDTYDDWKPALEAVGLRE
jgi:hypothetical protein